MKRPDGVTIVSIYHFVATGFFLLGICALITIPFIVGAATKLDPDGEIATSIVTVVMIVSAFVCLVFAAAHAVVGWGLWQLRPWARWGAVVLAGLLAIGFIPIGTAIGGGIIWYLFQPEARQAFGEEV